MLDPATDGEGKALLNAARARSPKGGSPEAIIGIGGCLFRLDTAPPPHVIGRGSVRRKGGTVVLTGLETDVCGAQSALGRRDRAILLDPADGRILLRRPGYVIEPHRDPGWGFLTCLAYLARPGDNKEWGTQLYRVREDAKAPDDACSKQVLDHYGMLLFRRGQA